MKNLIVYYEQDILKTKLEDVPIPVPGPDEVLIKVEVTGINPKDWKHPQRHLFNNSINQGDDCGGTIVAVGNLVKSLQVGERVAGFHEMDTPGGTYAEYTICPENTVFRIPDSMTFEEAATLPLNAFTAAVGLYRDLGLPAPWERSDDESANTGKIPLVVNGASSAVGAFAVQLAKMNPRIRPIVVTAGSSAGFVRGLDVDAVVDYRSTTVQVDLLEALNGTKVGHILDVTHSLASIQYLTPIMTPNARYVATSMIHASPELGVDDSMEKALQAAGAWYDMLYVGDVHEQRKLGQMAFSPKAGGRLFGALMSTVFEKALVNGTFAPHPFQRVDRGLLGIEAALYTLKEPQRSGNAKFVARLADTPAV